jgi:hypothetical protein
MPGRPNFESLTIDGAELIVSGRSDGDPLPVDIRVFVEQGAQTAQGSAQGKVDRVNTGWVATFDAAGFEKGKPALAFGVEIRTQPFEASSWSQMVTIE